MTNNDECRKLLPCPFCGGCAWYLSNKEQDGKLFHNVRCKKCYVAFDGCSDKESVVAAWNTRTLPPVTDDYDAAMYEIGEIVRVARDNPAGLRDFLMLNFPKQWGLSDEQHRELVMRAPVTEAEVEAGGAAIAEALFYSHGYASSQPMTEAAEACLEAARKVRG